jgi:nitrite reductase/ring-hydroxylating ferredoxin subunit
MLSQEENELLTKTGPGTPSGELLRRYWQPAALLAELPPGGPPLPVRLLGEDLVLFRDEEGRPGLIGLRCSHRGADLSYGRLEDGGIRCPYHGWLYDISGRCLEQPGEPAGSTFHEKIEHLAYPCQTVGGLILAYLGPGEPPLVPSYDILLAPDDRRRNTKVYRECNYLQGNEGNIDSVHLSFLHSQQPRWRKNPGFDEVQIESTNHGIRNYWVRHLEDGNYVHITSFVMPNMGAFGGGRGEGYSCNWHVPIDDTHHWEYVINFRYEAPSEEWWSRQADQGELGLDYRPVRNLANRYLQDRDEQKTRTFLGLGGYFYAHDGYATETPGPIQDRTQEHLGFGDQAIIAERRMLLKAIVAMKEGLDPLGVVRDPVDNRFEIVSRGEEIPASWDWRIYWQQNKGGTAV